MTEETHVNKAEAKLIAMDAAQSAIDSHIQNLPALMKPVMYEVSEKVAGRIESSHKRLLSGVLEIDVDNHEHVREFHNVMAYTRKKHSDAIMLQEEAKKTTVRGLVKWLGGGVVSIISIGGIVVWLASHGG